MALVFTDPHGGYGLWQKALCCFWESAALGRSSFTYIVLLHQPFPWRRNRWESGAHTVVWRWHWNAGWSLLATERGSPWIAWPNAAALPLSLTDLSITFQNSCPTSSVILILARYTFHPIYIKQDIIDFRFFCFFFFYPDEPKSYLPRQSWILKTSGYIWKQRCIGVFFFSKNVPL